MILGPCVVSTANFIKRKECTINTFYATTEFAIERFRTFYQTAAIFEHCEAAKSRTVPVASDVYDLYEEYENLYLFPS